MKTVRVNHAGGSFQLMDEPIRDPEPGSARIKVQACGVCHSDLFTKEGAWPGIVYPRTPGHEIAGVIDGIGGDGGIWKVGDRVGVGWYGGHDGQCDPCRRGDFIGCEKLRVPGISYDGGYAEFVYAPLYTLARIPPELTPEEAAPIMCAGITTFNALRNSGGRPGDLAGHPGNRRPWAPGRSVRQQIRFPDCRNRPWERQETSRTQPGRANLHQQCVAGCGKGTTTHGWRQRDSRDCTRRQGDQQFG